MRIFLHNGLDIEVYDLRPNELHYTTNTAAAAAAATTTTTTTTKNCEAGG